jgi:hypothetical protein
MDPEGGEVLRKLPRSRPGTRSSKRGPGGTSETKSARTEPPERTADPVASAVGTVVRVAGAVSREVLRRLPRL